MIFRDRVRRDVATIEAAAIRLRAQGDRGRAAGSSLDAITAWIQAATDQNAQMCRECVGLYRQTQRPSIGIY